MQWLEAKGKPATPKTELPPSTQLRKAVSGGSQMIFQQIFRIIWRVVLYVVVILAVSCSKSDQEDNKSASGSQRPSATLQGHTETVHCLAFSPDGKTLVTAGGRRGKGGEVILWDVPTRKQRTKLKGIGSLVVGVAFSPDGKIIATRTLLFDETVKLWDVATGEERLTLKQEGCVVSMAFSADGMTIATGGLGSDGSVTLWDVISGKIQSSIPGHSEDVSQVVFSSDGKTLATGGGSDFTVKLWDLTTKKPLPLKHEGSISCVAFSPDGKLVASSGLDSTMHLWDVGTGIEKAGLKHGSFDPSKNPPLVFVESVNFSPDGQTLATVGSDRTVKLWEVNTGKELATLAGYLVVFSPKGQTVVTANGERAKLWNAVSGKEQLTLSGHADAITCLGVSPDGKSVASGSTDKTVRIWDIEKALK